MDLQIKHESAQHKFFAVVNGKEAFLEYSKVNDKTLDYHYTFVPPELRGQQIAEKIVKFGLDYAEQQHYKIIPTCPYVKRIIERNPQYKKLVAE